MILADHREEPSGVISYLRSFSINVEVKQLPAGDYLFSDVAVERKTVQDLLASLNDGRLWNELYAIKTNYSRPVMILEGIIAEPLNKAEAIINSQLYGALVSIAIGELRIPIIPTISSKETARVIQRMYMRADKTKTEYLKPIARKSKDIWSAKYDMIACIPDVGRKRAQLIVDKFGTIKSICEASIEEIDSINGISIDTATKIKKALTE